MTRRATKRQAEFVTPLGDADDDIGAERISAHIRCAWTQALQDLMGYPVCRSGADRVVFICGGVDPTDPQDHARNLVETFDRDIVFLDFRGPVQDGPTNVVFATKSRNGVDVYSDCEAWRFKTYLAAELVAGTHRIQVLDGRIKMRSNNLDEMRARRVALTRQAWRALALEWAKDDLPGWKPVPTERVAAEGAAGHSEVKQVIEAYAGNKKKPVQT